MPGTLNGIYFEQLAARDRIPRYAALQFMSWRMGATRQNEFLVNDGAGCSPEAWQEYLSSENYAGWSRPGSLYCSKAGHRLDGIPRDIFNSNWCPVCRGRLSSRDDAEKDLIGYDIYRRFNSEVTQLAVERYSAHIRHGDLITKRGMTRGFHKDHCLSVRRGFDLNLAVAQVSSPVNLEVISDIENLSKGPRCSIEPAELAERYVQFLAAVPSWDDQVSELIEGRLE